MAVSHGHRQPLTAADSSRPAFDEPATAAGPVACWARSPRRSFYVGSDAGEGGLGDWTTLLSFIFILSLLLWLLLLLLLLLLLVLVVVI
jgi:hypothetical protein